MIQLQSPLQVVFIITSSLSIAAIAVDRSIVICLPAVSNFTARWEANLLLRQMRIAVWLSSVMDHLNEPETDLFGSYVSNFQTRFQNLNKFKNEWSLIKSLFKAKASQKSYLGFTVKFSKDTFLSCCVENALVWLIDVIQIQI